MAVRLLASGRLPMASGSRGRCSASFRDPALRAEPTAAVCAARLSAARRRAWFHCESSWVADVSEVADVPAVAD
eukprot:3938002-Rhodomonas_salina.3